MPQIKSSKKRMQLSRKRAERNQARRSSIKTAVRRVRQSTDPDEARERLAEAFALLDRAATKGLIHQNKVNRMKSQLHRHVNELED